MTLTLAHVHCIQLVFRKQMYMHIVRDAHVHAFQVELPPLSKHISQIAYMN